MKEDRAKSNELEKPPDEAHGDERLIGVVLLVVGIPLCGAGILGAFLPMYTESWEEIRNLAIIVVMGVVLSCAGVAALRN